MGDRTLIEQLRAQPQLAGCSDDELRELAEHSSPITVPANWAFILEGMPGDTCYLVLDGEVSVRRAGEEINRVGSGTLVGELAILEERPRSATCVAMTPLRLLEIEASEFNGWLVQRPHIREQLLGAATSRDALR